MRRFLIGSLTAYAIVVSLLTLSLGVRALFYRELFARLMQGKHGHSVTYRSLPEILMDFGIERSPLENLMIRFADLDVPTWLVGSAGILGLCLGAAVLARENPVQAPGLPVRSSRAFRWAVWGCLVAWLALAASLALTWVFVRRQVLHPNPWPTLVLAIALVGGAGIGMVAGTWTVLRGRRRLAGACCAGAAVLALSPWVLVGGYAYDQWGQRRVPNTWAMNIAKMAGAAAVRFEAAVEYPQRLETARLVMYYNHLADPQGDAVAMDQHLARLESMLGGRLRSQVYWIRGRTPRLNLGNLSIHGLALGSDASPADWNRGGRLDRHELAHAALDQYQRKTDSDPPFLLHEGWAESQGGADARELAQAALNQRAANPTFGLRALVGSDWYHQDDGPVYSIGGAFVAYLIRVHGVAAFHRLYREANPATFDASVRSIFGMDLDALEARFWGDAQRQANPPAPRQHDPFRPGPEEPKGWLIPPPMTPRPTPSKRGSPILKGGWRPPKEGQPAPSRSTSRRSGSWSMAGAKAGRSGRVRLVGRG